MGVVYRSHRDCVDVFNKRLPAGIAHEYYGGGKTSTSTQSVSIPPEVLARYNAVNTKAEDVAKQGFQQYSSDPNAFVSPLTAGQQAGVANTNQYANAAQPYYGAAAGMTAAGAGPINAGELNTQKYMNPFTKNVADTTQQALQQQQEQAMSGQTGNAIRSGAFGGDRSGIAAAVAQRQNQQGMAQAIAPIYERGYSQAQQTAAQQQGVGLGAEQANAARYMQAGQQLAGLGSAAQTAGLQGAQAQLAAGKEQQQTEQAGKTAMYNQFLQQQGYPFQVAQFLANIAMGTGALSGSTTTTTQPSSMFSDRRLKHDIRKIGETDDGQPIYKFKYKGDPKEQTHIGLMAQEVEKKHPEAVGLSGGYKTVDYDKATRFAEGGLVPSSMGGAVDDDVAYEGFADGGMPSLSIFGMPGGGNSRIPAEVLMQMQNMPKRELMRPAAPPQAQPNALQQAQAGLNAGKTITEGYKTGKSALFGAAPTPDDKEGSRGLLSNTGSPGMSGGWLDYVKNLGSSATPAARGGVMGYAGGGMPYGDDDTDSTDILGDVVKQGQQHASLPKPGEAPKAPQSGIGQLAQGVGALTGGIKAAQGLYTGAGKLGSMISGLGSAAEGAGAAAGAAGTLGSIGSGLAAAGLTAAEILPFLALLSDERAKHDKKKVGELYDGQPVYSYKYNGDNRTQLGLMAQNVERSHPEAVGSMHGMKMVDYDRATSAAADRGHFYSGGLVPRHEYQEGGPPADYSPGADLPAMGAQDAELVSRNPGPNEVIPFVREQAAKRGLNPDVVENLVRAEYGSGKAYLGDEGSSGGPLQMHYGNVAKSPNLRRAGLGDEFTKATGLDARDPSTWKESTEYGLDAMKKQGLTPWLTSMRKLGYAPDSAHTGTGISPARVQLAARDTGTATDAPSGFRATADDLANRFVRPSPGAGPQQGGEGLGGLMKSEKFWIPLLSGLGAMAASPSRYLGSAILTGLGGGAQAYSDLQKQQSGLEKQQADTNQVKAITEQTGAQTEGIYTENFLRSFKDTPYGRVVFLATGAPILASEYDRRWKAGERLPLLGKVPPNAEERAAQVFGKGQPASTMGTSTPPNIPKVPGAPTAPATSTLPPVNSSPPEPAAKVADTHAPAPFEPARPQPVPVGVNYDDKSRELAKSEADGAMNAGPLLDLYKKQTGEYDSLVKKQVSTAQENSPYLNQLATTISNAYKGKGFDTPGYLAGTRAEVMRAANTLSRSFGGPNISDLDADQDIINKISTLLGSQGAASGNQESYAALNAIRNAIPNLQMNPEAGARLTAELMMMKQRALDRDAHSSLYARDSGGLLSQAARDFRDKNPDGKYETETSIMEDLIKNKADQLKQMMSGTVSPKHIDEAIRKWYGNNAPAGMHRYFASRAS